ncbi:MAG TPA: hypothetical protein VM681_01780 [Candidatus Thermoplasmatota archaeon]|nr:hypothetical protein [Candidatus Thermoplasmatota archaeon]
MPPTRALRAFEALGVSLVVLLAGCLGNQERPGGPSADSSPGEPASRFVHIHGVAVDPGDPTVLFVATHAGLIRGTSGDRWAYVGADRSDFMGFTLHPDDNQTAWSSGHPAGGGSQGVRQTTDGGRTWRVVALGGQVDCHGMAVARANPDIVYCAHSGTGFYRTANRQDFERVATNGLAEPALVLATPAAAENTVYAGGLHGLQRSTDRGTTWTTVAGEGHAVTALAAHPEDASVLFAYFLRAGGLQRSEDAGETWIPAGTGLPADAVVTALAIDPSNPDSLYASAITTIWQSADGGASWHVLRRGDP